MENSLQGTVICFYATLCFGLRRRPMPWFSGCLSCSCSGRGSSEPSIFHGPFSLMEHWNLKT